MNDPLVTLTVTRAPDGRFKIKSPDLPGLFLASYDWPALCRDLAVCVPDLMRENRGITMERPNL